ncbi:hypothetical protein MRB53_036901 [Persea americana]|nr:hypothetical protein MRB53_036901 [Persea americana]
MRYHRLDAAVIKALFDSSRTLLDRNRVDIAHLGRVSDSSMSGWLANEFAALCCYRNLAWPPCSHYYDGKTRSGKLVRAYKQPAGTSGWSAPRIATILQ